MSLINNVLVIRLDFNNALRLYLIYNYSVKNSKSKMHIQPSTSANYAAGVHSADVAKRYKLKATDGTITRNNEIVSHVPSMKPYSPLLRIVVAIVVGAMLTGNLCVQ